MIYDDYVGRGESPFANFGGIKKLEGDHGTSWRQSFSQGERKKLSRVKFIADEIDRRKQAYFDEGDAEEDCVKRALDFFDNLMKTKKSLSSMESFLKTQRKSLEQERAMAQAHLEENGAHL